MQNLQKLGEQLVAFYDIDAQRAQAAAKNHGGKAYANFDQMLAAEKLDALYICVPPDGHVGQEQKAAAKGIHLFIEKPIANSMDTALDILDAVEKSGVIASVGYHFRYMDSTAQAKKILRGKKVGMVLGYWIGGLPGAPWWRVMSRSGGQIVEQTTHIFDLARYLVGEVRRVSAVAALTNLRDVPNLDVWDVGAVNLEFKNGAIGNISNSCMIGQGYAVGLHLFAKDLVLELTSNLKVSQPGRTEEIRGANDAYLDEDAAFFQAIRAGSDKGVRSTYADAVKTLALTLAANRSAQTHQVVEV